MVPVEIPINQPNWTGKWRREESITSLDSLYIQGWLTKASELENPKRNYRGAVSSSQKTKATAFVMYYQCSGN